MQFHNFAKFDNFSLQISIPTNKLSPYKTNELSIIFIPKSVRSSNKIRIQRFPRFDVEAVRGQRHRRKDLECRAWRKLSRRVLITRDQVVRHGYRGDISRRHWHNSLPSAIFFSLSLFSFPSSLSLSLSPSLFSPSSLSPIVYVPQDEPASNNSSRWRDRFEISSSPVRVYYVYTGINLGR